MQGVFVGTFLIGLREGLEAVLIVSIVATFLKRSGRSLRPMAVGVGAAVALSIAVGVGLNLLSENLPQRQQEMLETVIGAIAIVFVTTMIVWMNRHAFQMKGQLESEARQAINNGGALALATMAFLAVLKEGFETSVFLLAAAQASGGDRLWAVLGAVTGIGAAVGLGIAMYHGALRLNLARFFRATGVFLILIAAGLVIGTLRTAHEAGWVNIGQQKVLDFSGWMPSHSALGALITGMFGIPPDPRLIEVLGWLLYTIGVMIVFLWPPTLAAEPAQRRRLLLGAGAVLGIAAAALAVFVPADGELPGPGRTSADGRTSVTLRTDGGAAALSVDTGTETRDVQLDTAGRRTLDGVILDVRQAKIGVAPDQTGTTVTLAELTALQGGRLPVGLNAVRTPGPFTVRWNASRSYEVLSHDDSLVHAEATGSRIATLRGGGLSGTKTVSVGTLPGDWATAAADDDAVLTEIRQARQTRDERMLWKAWLPAVLGIGAAWLIVSGLRLRTTKPIDTDVDAQNEPERTQHSDDQESERDRSRAP